MGALWLGAIGSPIWILTVSKYSRGEPGGFLALVYGVLHCEITLWMRSAVMNRLLELGLLGTFITHSEERLRLDNLQAQTLETLDP